MIDFVLEISCNMILYLFYGIAGQIDFKKVQYMLKEHHRSVLYFLTFQATYGRNMTWQHMFLYLSVKVGL